MHDEAAQLWQEEQQQAALQKVAEAMAQEVNAGKSLKDVAAEHKLAVLTSTPLTRDGGDARVPPPLVAKLFDAKTGAAVTDATTGNVVVAQLLSVEPADPAKDTAAVQQMSKDVGTTLQTDMLGQFSQGLRHTFPVKIDQASVDRLL